MAPPFCFIIGRLAARMSAKAPLRLVARVRSQSSSLKRMTRPSTAMPALFTSTSRRPCALTMPSTAAWQACGVRHVELHGLARGAGGLQQPQRLLGRGLVARVADDDLGARLRERHRARPADAARAAGDQHDLALQSLLMLPPVRRASCPGSRRPRR